QLALAPQTCLPSESPRPGCCGTMLVLSLSILVPGLLFLVARERGPGYPAHKAPRRRNPTPSVRRLPCAPAILPLPTVLLRAPPRPTDTRTRPHPPSLRTPGCFSATLRPSAERPPDRLATAGPWRVPSR